MERDGRWVGRSIRAVEHRRHVTGDVAPLIPALARDDFVPVEMPLLARERVRHAGEAVAMVVAATPHAAEDGAERVRVEYEEEEAVASLEAAIADGAPAVHDE